MLEGFRLAVTHTILILRGWSEMNQVISTNCVMRPPVVCWGALTQGEGLVGRTEVILSRSERGYTRGPE